MSRPLKTIIVWYRNDLRINDHPALAAAVAAADRVIPLFIWNPGLLHGRHASSNRNRFLLECLQDLRRSFGERGGNIILRSGQPGEVLLQVAKEYAADEVHYTIDYSPLARQRDQLVTAQLTGKGLKVRAFPGKLMVDSLEGVVTKSGTVFKVFTPFWKNWETVPRREVCEAPKKIALPDGITPGELPVLAGLTRPADLAKRPLPGGETAGRQRLADFLETGITTYADNHSRLQPRGGTSQLSPYLKFGCVSVREIEDRLPPQNGNQSKGPAAFHRQLAWRDFYNYILFHYPANATEEFQERYRGMDWDGDGTLLSAWQQGRTGYPVVDAAMRQLLQEGWMHNRARLIVGSFLTKDLALDWRAGESWFMRHLLDGDEANNNGNWQWIASVGVDPAPVFRRLYNPASQQKNYDPDGSYVRFYVPELQHVPDKYVSEPWRLSDQEQLAVKCVIGKDYPAPIVDHAAARLAALERYRR